MDTVAFENMLNVVQFDFIVEAKGKYFYQAMKQVKIPKGGVKDFLRGYQAIVIK